MEDKDNINGTEMNDNSVQEEDVLDIERRIRALEEKIGSMKSEDAFDEKDLAGNEENAAIEADLSDDAETAETNEAEENGTDETESVEEESLTEEENSLIISKETMDALNETAETHEQDIESVQEEAPADEETKETVTEESEAVEEIKNEEKVIEEEPVAETAETVTEESEEIIEEEKKPEENEEPVTETEEAEETVSEDETTETEETENKQAPVEIEETSVEEAATKEDTEEITEEEAPEETPAEETETQEETEERSLEDETTVAENVDDLKNQIEEKLRDVEEQSNLLLEYLAEKMADSRDQAASVYDNVKRDLQNDVEETRIKNGLTSEEAEQTDVETGEEEAAASTEESTESVTETPEETTEEDVAETEETPTEAEAPVVESADTVETEQETEIEAVPEEEAEQKETTEPVEETVTEPVEEKKEEASEETVAETETQKETENAPTEEKQETTEQKPAEGETTEPETETKPEEKTEETVKEETSIETKPETEKTPVEETKPEAPVTPEEKTETEPVKEEKPEQPEQPEEKKKEETPVTPEKKEPEQKEEKKPEQKKQNKKKPAKKKKKSGRLTNKQYRNIATLAVLMALAVSAYFMFPMLQRDGRYQNAIQQMERGEFAEAYESLNGLSGYKDADRYITYCDALKYYSNGELDQAIEAFASVGDLGEAQQYISYITAEKTISSSTDADDFSKAADLFKQAGNLLDSKAMVDYCQGIIAFLNNKSNATELLKKIVNKKEIKDVYYNDASDLLHYIDAGVAFDNDDLSSYDTLRELASKEGSFVSRMKGGYTEYVKGLDCLEKEQFFSAYTCFKNSYGLKDAEELAETCFQPRPVSGILYRNASSGSVEVTVYDTEDDKDMYLKIYDENNELIETLYIRDGEYATAYFQGGAFRMAVAYGENGWWFGPEESFGSTGIYQRLLLSGNDEYFEFPSGSSYSLRFDVDDGNVNRRSSDYGDF